MRPYFAPGALADITDIWEYTFERWDLTQAERYVSILTAACEDLALELKHGRSIVGLAQGYLAYLIESHVIVYRLIRNDSTYSIEVVRFLHGRRDFANMRL